MAVAAVLHGAQPGGKLPLCTEVGVVDRGQVQWHRPTMVEGEFMKEDKQSGKKNQSGLLDGGLYP